MKQETASGMKPVPNKNIIMAVTLLAMFMAVLDSVIVSIALPTITAFFKADLSVSQWTITGYLVTMTATMLVFARLSVYYGKNRIFLFGMAVFTASSFGCALAPTLPALIALRILQGLGAAMSVSILMAIVFDIHSFHEHGKAMGILGATVALASISGPVLGGFLVELCGWQSIFLINIPLGIVLLVLGYYSMDLKKPVLTNNFIMDRAGAGSLMIAVASFMLALGFIGDGGIASIPGAVCGCLYLAALVLFIRTERRHPCPLIDLDIFSVRLFVVPLLCMCLFFSAIMILYVTLPLFLESVMAFTPSQVGWFFVLMAAIVTVGSPLVGRAYDRFSWKSYTPTGLMVAAAGFLFFSVSTGTTDIAIQAGALIVVAIGFALIQSPVNTEIMRGLPPEQSATASGLNSAGRHFAMAFGASVAALIFSLRLHDSGYSGAVTGADPALVAGTTSLALAIAGVLCIAGVVLTMVIKE
jgi:EmrB/QacA subfamily drug resistance transporter